MSSPRRWTDNDPLPSHGQDHELCESRSSYMVLVHQPDMGFCLLRNQEYRGTNL
ncbi:hypothetical protein HanXRQr2_Chr17g0825981 [Helianthus annuus]|uniref:Uncharacterized protein n=1 Tax=Helianthus annuus TaxID=4232 RepID=A0A9K3GVI3_HELAN|nr:hypothetical protein HanXRQr2_Chr17g0825981 [Helianthus annuus]